ncbi:MAG: hypothetical protein K9H84_00980 [Bacteroidales bacterium]|nr:hypothetical protein [Bacteroidales bacterium]
MIQRLLIIFLVISMAGCVSSRKYLQRGQYDRAIEKSVKKLSRKPDKRDEQGVLKKAYNLAMEEDKQHIRELRMSGQPEVYEEIYLLYERMEQRQNIVRRLPSRVLNKINYKYVNFEKEKINAKKKAAEYLYAHAKKLLESKSRFDARKAYNEFVRLKNILPSYKNTDQLMREALAKGQSEVLFTMSNKSNTALPKGFESELYKISLADLNTQWINYDTRQVKGKNYDYYIDLELKGIMVSPEQVKQNEYTETKTVDDGWEYVLDKNGNVKKDSLGNDMKVKKTKEISCKIIETQMLKHTTITGRLEFIKAAQNQVMKTDPVAAEWHFEHAYIQTYGNIDALSKETKEKLGVKPVPFPPSPDMILNAVTVLKEVSKDAIYSHRGMFQ